MDRLDSALQEFTADLHRARHLVEFVKLVRGFGASSVPEDSSQCSEWPEAVKLWEESKQRRTDLPLMAGSLLLYLTGRFEYFARFVVEIGAEEVAGKCQEFSHLPERLRTELLRRTGEVIANPKRFGYDAVAVEGFVFALADGLRARTGLLTINSACLSATETNLRPDVLEDLTRRIGMTGFWSEVGKQSKLKLYLQTASDQDTTSEAKNRLNELMEERNHIAHPTASTIFPDPDKVLVVTKFLDLLAQITCDIIRLYINSFKVKAAGAVGS